MSSLRGMLDPQPLTEDRTTTEAPVVCYFFGKFSDCYNVNPLYCSLCRKYLCDTCRHDYWRRMEGLGEVVRDQVTQGIRQVFNNFL